MKRIVDKLKRNTLFLLIICYLSKLWNSISMFNKINGKSNLLKFSTYTFFRKVKINVKGHNNKITSIGNVTMRNMKIEINGSNNEFMVNDGVRFYEGAKILIEGNNCKVFIGSKSTIGSANLFCSESNTSIIIGVDCMFGREIKVLTGDFHSIIDINTKKRINPSKDIIIGNHVWVGYHSCISKGSKIPDNSVVASFSLVTNVFTEPNVILAGTPAKIIKNNIDWDRKKLPII